MSNYLFTEPNEFQIDEILENLNSSCLNLLNPEFSNHINNAFDIENNFHLEDEIDLSSKYLSTGITNSETKNYIGKKRYFGNDESINDLKEFKSIINKNKSEDLNISFKKQIGCYQKRIIKKKFKKKKIYPKPDLNSHKNDQNVQFNGTIKKAQKMFKKKRILKKFKVPFHHFTKNGTF